MKLIYVLFFFIGIASYGQNDISPNDILGFACSESARNTNSVLTVEKLISEKNIFKLRNSLYSDQILIAYLSGAILKDLEFKNKILLSKDENMQILKILSSNKIISICHTCLLHKRTKIYSVENNQVDEEFSEYFKNWRTKMVDSLIY